MFFPQFIDILKIQHIVQKWTLFLMFLKNSFINQNQVHNNIRITKPRFWDSQVTHIDAHLGMISTVNQINQR